MALDASHPIQSSLYDGQIGLSTGRQACQAYGEMSYPPPPQNLVSPDMGLPHSELPGSYIRSHSDSGSVDGVSNWPLQRSFTAPDGDSMAEQPQAAAHGDKKRNKLGYHRTSVACNHCRGRKIRCIPAANDTQGRCASCIRLKRECSFKPTEQQRGTEARSRSAAHPGIEQRSSASSSPTPSGRTPSQPPSQRVFPPLTTNVPHMRQPMNAPPVGDGSMTSLSAGQQYNFNQGMPSYTSSNINPYLDSAPPSWNNPWSSQQLDSPISEQPPDTPLSATWAPGPGSQEANWGGMPVPVRSMSYNGESLGTTPYEHMLHSGQHPPGYASGPVPNSSVEGFQIDAGSTASMLAPLAMQWQQHPHLRGPQHVYPGWSQGDSSQLQPRTSGQTALGGDESGSSVAEAQ